MLTRKMINCVETHTEGMPTRIILSGLPRILGTTMSERREFALESLVELRQFLMREPRGHAGMFGAILTEPTVPEADWGVLFTNSRNIVPMCGHGTIGVATALVEMGMVEASEATTRVRLDTPAGIVTAEVSMEGGRVSSVTFRNVPAFVLAEGQALEVPGLGQVDYDLVWGGNFYAIVKAAPLGLKIALTSKDTLIRSGVAIIDAINLHAPPVHPSNPSIRGLAAVEFVDGGSEESDARNVVISQSGYFDRSPCGTGTSALMALRHSRGELKLGQPFRNESILGRCFIGELVETTVVSGIHAVIPKITGRAWITGTSQFFLDPTDPFPQGFVV